MELPIATACHFPTARSLPLMQTTRSLSFVSVAALSILSSCFSFGARADVGYTQMAVTGNVAYTTGLSGGTINASQDVESGLGLGDQSGSPYGRVELDFGVPRLQLSAFQFADEGTGTLQANFGNISSGVDVRSKLEFTNVKGSFSFDIDLGPLRVSPGLAVDFFDAHLEVADTGGLVSETIDEPLPLPLLFLGAGADFGILSLDGEVGYLDTPKVQGIEGKVLDAEAMLRLKPMPLLELFAGYRFLNLQASGEFNQDRGSLDLDIQGWVVGGGIRF